MTLIEVLVSIVLASIGLIGLLGLLASTLQTGTNAQDRSRAALLANELATAMWLNKSVDVTSGPLATDYATWQANVASALYGTAQGSSNLNGNVATITITWTPSNQSASKQANTVNAYANNVVNNNYTTEVIIP